MSGLRQLNHREDVPVLWSSHNESSRSSRYPHNRLAEMGGNVNLNLTWDLTLKIADTVTVPWLSWWWPSPGSAWQVLQTGRKRLGWVWFTKLSAPHHRRHGL